MSLSREQVEKVSLLARLRLTPEELERMTTQLGQIVGYVEQLAELKTDDVAPMSHPLEMANVFRPDELRPSLDRANFDRAKMLANSPHSDGESYLVPAVLGD
jgi:aspartyl-tRNA(Asn)/glutamyl-tRNA(Gln) amidotransferase subunit C